MTKIEWTDKTWNPVTGCTKCSPGCENCYAEKMHKRLQAMGIPKYKHGFSWVCSHRGSLEEPYYWQKPKKVFVCSMSDLFHEQSDLFFVEEVMNVIYYTPRHTYQILTKRPERMKFFFKNSPYANMDNLWLGVTVCNQAEADEKIPILLDTPAKVRFVSVEPMLEEIGLRPFIRGLVTNYQNRHYLDWVICGGETGANARSMHPDWARALRDQCKSSGVPFFFKQMAKKQPIPDDLLVREFPKGGNT